MWSHTYGTLYSTATGWVSQWSAKTTCCSCWSHFSCPTICRWKTTGARSKPNGSGSATPLFTNGCRSEFSCQKTETKTKLDSLHAAQGSTPALGCWRASRSRWMQQMQAPSRAWNGCMQGMFLRPQLYSSRTCARWRKLIIYELFKWSQECGGRKGSYLCVSVFFFWKLAGVPCGRGTGACRTGRPASGHPHHAWPTPWLPGSSSPAKHRGIGTPDPPTRPLRRQQC